MFFLLALTLQAETQPSTPSVGDQSQAVSASGNAEVRGSGDVPAERKRICRTVLDTSTGPIAKPRKICRFADELPK